MSVVNSLRVRRYGRVFARRSHGFIKRHERLELVTRATAARARGVCTQRGAVQRTRASHNLGGRPVHRFRVVVQCLASRVAPTSTAPTSPMCHLLQHRQLPLSCDADSGGAAPPTYVPTRLLQNVWRAKTRTAQQSSAVRGSLSW